MTDQEVLDHSYKLESLREQFEKQFHLDIWHVYEWLKNHQALPHPKAVHQRDELLSGVLIAAIEAGLCKPDESPSSEDLLEMLCELGLAAKGASRHQRPPDPVYACHACGSICSQPEPYKLYVVCNTCHVHTAGTVAMALGRKKSNIDENLRIVLDKLLKEELDNVEHLVHVCDQNDDAIKARQLPQHILDLYNFLNPEVK